MTTQVILKADDGKILTNGSTYADEVWLSETDSPDNWTEVDKPQDQSPEQ